MASIIKADQILIWKHPLIAPDYNVIADSTALHQTRTNKDLCTNMRVRERDDVI